MAPLVSPLTQRPRRAGLVDAHPPAHRLADRFLRRVDQTQADAALVDDDGGVEAVGPVGDQGRHDGVGEIEPAGVERHADLGVGADLVQRPDLVGRGHASGDGDAAVLAGGGDDGLGELEVGAAHPALELDEGHQEPAGMGLQLGDALQDAPARPLLPALDHHLAVTRIQCGDDALARQLGEDLRAWRRCRG